MKNTLNLDQKYACVTIDIEKDYGDRVDAFNIYKDTPEELNNIGRLFKSTGVPLSLFITTSLLNENKGLIKYLYLLGTDFHCHSHTHNTIHPNSHQEITRSFETFKDYFSFEPQGYRAPQGVITT